MLETLTREDFMDNILKENSEIIHKYMEENDVTLKSVTDEV